MSRRDPQVRLRHMLDAAREARQLSGEVDRSHLEDNRVLTLALIRLLEIVGEAARKIPSNERPIHPDIPWQAIIGLRHRLIHGYDQVDMEILWQILNYDLGQLVEALEELLNSD